MALKLNITAGYTLSEDSKVMLSLYAAAGEAKILLNADQLQGRYEQQFSARDLGIRPGIYFAVLDVNGKTSSIKICITE